MYPSNFGAGISRKTQPIPGNKYFGLNNPSPLTTQYGTYNAAVDEDAHNRDELSQGYRDFGSRIRDQSGARGTMSPGVYTPGAYVPTPYKPSQPFTPTLQNAPEKYSPEMFGSPEQYKPTQLGEPELYKPGQFDYKESPDLIDAIRNLKGLSESGGYTEAGIADLRERGISPIRSIYANANRDIERGRTLAGGGTSASFNANKARMARELSDKIGGITTDVNANIAENVARNKIAIAPTYAGAAANESGLRNQYGKANVDESNRAGLINSGLINDTNRYNNELVNNTNGMNTDLINRFMQMNTGLRNDANKYNLNERTRVNEGNVDRTNSANIFNFGETSRVNDKNTETMNEGMKFDTINNNEGRRFNMELPFKTGAFNREGEDRDNENIFKSLEGLRSLFGTTPALSQLFGNQALNFSGQQSGINQANQSRGMDIISEILKRYGGGVSAGAGR